MSAAARHPKHETARAELEGGAVLFVEESHVLPLVSIVVAFRSGSAFDPIGKEGVARITGRMLRRGLALQAGKLVGGEVRRPDEPPEQIDERLDVAADDLRVDRER